MKMSEKYKLKWNVFFKCITELGGWIGSEPGADQSVKSNHLHYFRVPISYCASFHENSRGTCTNHIWCTFVRLFFNYICWKFLKWICEMFFSSAFHDWIMKTKALKLSSAWLTNTISIIFLSILWIRYIGVFRYARVARGACPAFWRTSVSGKMSRSGYRACNKNSQGWRRIK